MRVSLDGLGQAVDGDMTTTGATCIATGQCYFVEGRKVLRMGDRTTPCPLCGLEGKVVEGVWHFVSDGQPVAMDGALVDCGCPRGSNRVVAPLGEMPHSRSSVAGRTGLKPATPESSSALAGGAPTMIGGSPGQMQPGFYVVPRSMTFSQILLELASHDSTLPISYLQRLNPTFEQGFKAGEIFVIGDPDNGYACTEEEGQLMAAAERARRSLAVLDFAESDFMMEYQAEVAGLLSDASLSMGVGKDMMDHGLKQLRGTLGNIERLHQQEFLRHGHLNSPSFFAERRLLLEQLDGQLKAIFLNKYMNLGAYERLKKSLNISTKSLVHHWSKADGPGQIPGYVTYLDKVAKLSKYLRYGGYVGIALGGTSSYLKVQEVCRAGETEACKKIRLSETGAFTGGLAGGIVGGKLAGITALAVCGIFSAGTVGFGAPVCGIALVGGGAFAGSIAGAEGGEQMGELIYESHHD